MNKTLIAPVLLTLALAGCYKTTIKTNKPANGTTHSQKSNMFIGGLIGAEVTPPCEPAQIVTKRSFVDWLLSAVTVSLYTPMTVETTCAAEGATASR